VEGPQLFRGPLFTPLRSPASPVQSKFMAATPAQLHELLTYCMDFGQIMLKHSGEFYPFGAVLSPEGKVVAVGGSNGNEHPKAREIYHLLTETFEFAAKNGKIFGAALAANVNVPEQYDSPSRDALRVHLETQGYARFIYAPYEITKSGFLKRKSAIILHEHFSVDVNPVFFTPEAT
jgi:hypothetical protein